MGFVGAHSIFTITSSDLVKRVADWASLTTSINTALTNVSNTLSLAVTALGPAWAPYRNVPADQNMNTFKVPGLHRITTPDTATITNLPPGMRSAGLVENLITGDGTDTWWTQRITEMGKNPRTWWRVSLDTLGVFNAWALEGTAATEITDWHVFLAAGQSNMAGRAIVSASNGGKYVQPRIAQFGYNRRVLETATVPLDMHDALTASSQGLSPASVFAQAYLKTQPNNVGVLIIPAAHGGTGFTTSTTTQTWTPGITSNPLYDLPGAAVAQVTAALAAVAATGAAASLKGILWHQGEDNSTMSKASYITNLDALISFFRTQFGNPKLPFMLGQMAPENIAAITGRVNIDAAHQETPGRVLFTGFAPARTNGYNPGDQTHMSEDGVAYLGRNYLDAYDQARRNAPGDWQRGDLTTATDYDTFTAPGSYGVLFSNGANQPSPNAQNVDVRKFGTGLLQEATTWESQPRKFIRSNSGGAQKPWNEFQMAEQAFIDLRHALRYASLSPAQILWLADSIGEGTGGTTLANRAQTIVQDYLRRQFTPGLSGAQFPFIPARYATSAPGQPVASSGTITGGYGWGLGWRTVRLEDATSIITFTFTGTSAMLMFTKTSTTGVLDISVDGGASTILDTNGATNNAATWSTGALSQGVHTVVLKRHASSAAGQYPYVQGLFTYNGDETRGIRVVDASKHGVNSTQLTQANCDSTAQAMLASGSYAGAVIALGTNDYSSGTSVITYRDNILRQIASLRASGGFNGSILLLNTYMGGGRDNALWAPYGEQLSVIAAADPKVKYLDLRWDMPDVPTPSTDVAGQGMYADALHLTDAGNRKYAGVVVKEIAR